MEYKEVRAPKEVLDRWAALKAASTEDKPVTLGDAGVLTWLTELSKEGGWRVVWNFFFFPIVLLEREVERGPLVPSRETEEEEKN
jgi:hypothetical protein